MTNTALLQFPSLRIVHISHLEREKQPAGKKKEQEPEELNEEKKKKKKQENTCHNLELHATARVSG